MNLPFLDAQKSIKFFESAHLRRGDRLSDCSANPEDNLLKAISYGTHPASLEIRATSADAKTTPVTPIPTIRITTSSIGTPD
jgi:hypothetical protein